MIQIKKGDTILTVSKCSYNEIFKNQGYKIVEAKETKSKEKVEENKKMQEKIVNSSELTKKIDMGVEDNLFPFKENKGKK